jgi:hypothetical protein
MQNIGNERHTSGKRADLPLSVGGAHVKPRARCQLLGNSGVTRLPALQRQGRCHSAGAFGPDREFMNDKQTAQSPKMGSMPKRVGMRWSSPGNSGSFFRVKLGPPEFLHSRPHPDALSESGRRLVDARARRSSRQLIDDCKVLSRYTDTRVARW